MKKLSFFPINIYEFTCPNSLLERILNVAKTTEHSKNINHLRSTSDLFFDEELYLWLEDCIKSAKNDIGIPSSVDLDITGCWVNQYNKLQSLHLHRHNNSFLSGTLYLTEGHIGGDTVFVTKNIWMKDFEWIKFADGSNKFTCTETFSPKKGTLLLFPSSIAHSVNPVKDMSKRITISFNTFFSGPIDATSENLIRLEIKSKSVREHHKRVS